MYTYEQKCEAIETFVGFDHSCADTVAELGHLSRQTLRNRWLEHQRQGRVAEPSHRRESGYPTERRRAAVDCCLEHGKSPARAARAPGYPKGRATPAGWTDEPAPGQRKIHGRAQRTPAPALEERTRIAAALESRGGTAAEVAGGYGVSRCAPCHWRRGPLSGDDIPDGNACAEGGAVGARCDEPPDGAEGPRETAESLQQKVGRLEPEPDVRQATLEITKKDPGADPNRLTNGEKAPPIDSPRPKRKPRGLPEAVRIQGLGVTVPRRQSVRGKWASAPASPGSRRPSEKTGCAAK